MIYHFYFLFMFMVFFLTAIILYEINIETPWETIDIPMSKCLDGSNYRFLVSKNSFTTSSNNFLIFFQGGGLCGTEGKDFSGSCLDRASTNLGSNVFDFSVNKIYSKYMQLFSNNYQHNKHFYDWKKVFVKYCDGSLHRGYINEPVIVEGKKLYFHGEKNVIDVGDYGYSILRLYRAENVLVTGSSAGGYASMMWGNYIKSMVPGNTKTFIGNDSGYFDDFTNSKGNNVFRGYLQNMLKRGPFVYEDSPLMKELYKSNPKTLTESDYEYFLPKKFIQYIEVPVLMIGSLTDAWNVKMLLEEPCFYQTRGMLENCSGESIKEINNFAQQTKDNILALKNKNNQPLSLWYTKTLTHTFGMMSDAWDNPHWSIGNVTGNDVITEWITAVTNSTVDKTIQYIDTSDDKINKYYLKDIMWYIYYLGL